MYTVYSACAGSHGGAVSDTRGSSESTLVGFNSDFQVHVMLAFCEDHELAATKLITETRYSVEVKTFSDIRPHKTISGRLA